MYTGYGKRAGTTADVSFILSGDEGESEPRLLKDPKRKTFQRRGIDVFLATFPETFGELNYLHLWHNNAGTLNFRKRLHQRNAVVFKLMSSALDNRILKKSRLV